MFPTDCRKAAPQSRQSVPRSDLTAHSTAPIRLSQAFTDTQVSLPHSGGNSFSYISPFYHLKTVYAKRPADSAADLLRLEAISDTVSGISFAVTPHIFFTFTAAANFTRFYVYPVIFPCTRYYAFAFAIILPFFYFRDSGTWDNDSSALRGDIPVYLYLLLHTRFSYSVGLLCTRISRYQQITGGLFIRGIFFSLF